MNFPYEEAPPPPERPPPPEERLDEPLEERLDEPLEERLDEPLEELLPNIAMITLKISKTIQKALGEIIYKTAMNTIKPAIHQGDISLLVSCTEES